MADVNFCRGKTLESRVPAKKDPLFVVKFDRLALYSVHKYVDKLNRTRLELESQSRINAAQAGEIGAQAAEIELLRSEVFDLKR